MGGGVKNAGPIDKRTDIFMIDPDGSTPDQISRLNKLRRCPNCFTACGTREEEELSEADEEALRLRGGGEEGGSQSPVTIRKRGGTSHGVPPLSQSQ